MSRPIPIAPRSRGVPVARGRHSSSSSVPTAPVIGSLPPPSALEGDIPDMSLPESIPDAFSLAEIATAETTQRLVGVSSAPARSFIEHARRSGVDTGTSPTVLSILQQRGAEELLTPLKQHSEAYRQKGDTMDQISGGMSGFSIADGNAPRPGFPNAFAKQTDVGAQLPHTGGLAAMLSAPRSAVASSLPTQSMFMAQASSSFGASSSMGFKKGVVLATSFRDPSNLPPPLPEDLLTEAAGETSSDDEELGAAAARRRRAAAGGRGKSGLANSTAMDEDDDDDDDDDSPKISGRGHTSGLGRGNGRKMMDSRDEGVFGGDFS